MLTNKSNYIFVDSSKRLNKLNSNSNNFIISFNSQININNYIKLLSVVIPKTCYLINTKNNTFVITFNDNTTFNISLPINNYDYETLSITIKNLINYANFNMVFDDKTYCYLFTANQNFTIIFNSNINILFNMLKNINYVSNSNTLKTNIINFNFPLFLNIDLVNIESTFFNSDNSNANFIIPFNVERFGLLNYNNNLFNQINYVNKQYNLNNLHIRLLDENNELIDLNNCDFQMIFEFE